MFRIGRYPIFLMLILGMAQAEAASIDTELLGCRDIQSLSERLRCYDTLADEIKRRPRVEVKRDVAGSSQPAATPSPEVVSESRSTVAPEDLFGKTNEDVKEVVRRELDINTVNEIASLVVRTQQNANKEYIVYLENGQVWRQKSKAGSWRIKEGETAIISTASLGSYLMRSSERKKSVRAERLR